MTNIVNFKTKKALKEAVVNGEDFIINDPSIVAPKTFMATELPEGVSTTVTNHPKRSWFAIIKKTNGQLKVK